jgi:amidophosphoribosyltransferase
MGEIIEHNCGLGAVYLKEGCDDRGLVPQLLYSLGYDQIHRGQLACGMVTYNPASKKSGLILKPRKVIGRPNDLFCSDNPTERDKILKDHNGLAGVVHTRYATTEVTSDSSVFERSTQPMLREHNRRNKEFAFAFNGTLTNYLEIQKELRRKGEYHFKSETDTEVAVALLSRLINENMDENLHNPDNPQAEVNLEKVFRRFCERVDGGYSMITLFSDGNMALVRGRKGIRPLSWGENDLFYAVASESYPLERIGIKEEDIKSVPAGNLLLINQNGGQMIELLNEKDYSRCFFEWVYFAKVLSSLDGKSVYEVRSKLGENLEIPSELKKEIRANQDYFVVVPSPMTAIAAAESFANKYDLNYRQAIMKMEGMRGFINSQLVRYEIMGREYGVIRQIVGGKKILLVDDSKVRGETSERTAKMLLDSGALEVHEFITSPPIISPCFYGINMATHAELIARRNFSNNQDILEKRVAKEIGVKSVTYQSKEGLYDAIGFKENELCTACITGKYPTPEGKKLAKNDFEKFKKKKRRK